MLLADKTRWRATGLNAQAIWLVTCLCYLPVTSAWSPVTHVVATGATPEQITEPTSIGSNCRQVNWHYLNMAQDLLAYGLIRGRGVGITLLLYFAENELIYGQRLGTIANLGLPVSRTEGVRLRVGTKCRSRGIKEP